MNILAFDTSGEICSVALLSHGQIMQEIMTKPRKQAECLLPMIQKLLNITGVTIKQLDGLALTHGPGAFTGVRIAIGAAQGLCTAIDLPAVTVSTLAATAQSSYRQFNVQQALVAIDARMKEVYWGGYSIEDNAIMALKIKEQVSAPDDIQHYIKENESWIGVGSGWEVYAGVLPNYSAHARVYPEAQDVISLALPEFTKGNVLSAADIMPVYLRDKVVSIPAGMESRII